MMVTELLTDHFDYQETFYINTDGIEVIVPTKHTVYMASGDKYHLGFNSYKRLMSALGIEVDE